MVALHEFENLDGFNYVTFSSDGNSLIIANAYVDDKNPTLAYWDIKSLLPLSAAVIGASSVRSPISLNPSGELFIAVAFSDKLKELVLAAFQSNTGRRLFEAQYQTQELDFHISDLEWSPDSTLIAAGFLDGEVRAYHAEDLSRVFGVKIQPNEINTVAQIYTVAFSPDSQLLAAAGQDEIVRIWSTTDWNEKFIPDQSEAPIQDMVFSSDGRFLAVAEAGGLHIWDITTGKIIEQFNPRYKEFAVAYSPDNTLLAAAGQDRHIRIWRTNNFQLVADLTGHKSRVISLEFSSGGQFLVSRSMSTFNAFEKDPEKQGYKEKIVLWGLP